MNSRFSNSVIQEYLADIFGKTCGNTYQEGLVDSKDAEDFNDRLEACKETWRKRESLSPNSNHSSFFEYFSQYYAQVICHSMLKDVRTAAGLGYPPSKFSTNASESINAVMKRKVDYKETSWPEFNDSMKELVQQQRDEVLRSLSGRGQYRLCKRYEYLQVLPQQWVKMSPEQRKGIIKQFDSAALRSPSSSHNWDQASNSSSCLLPPSCSSGQSSDVSSRHPSVLCENSGIDVIPFVTLHSMWAKAEEYLNSKSDIVHAPGADQKARMLLSKSNITPHHVRCLPSGQYICDNNCLQWKSSQLCSHVLVVAELNGELDSFLMWYKSTNQQPNITALAMTGLPAGRGRKGGIAKRKRSKSVVAPNITVPRPGTIRKTSFNSSISQQNCDPGSSASSGQSPQQIAGPSQTATSCSNPILSQLMSCNFTNIGSLSPLISQAVSPKPSFIPNTNPFFIRLIEGNIRICQGCRTSLRNVNGSVPLPPYDLAVARHERRPYRDKSGELQTPQREQAVHYHVKVSCIRSCCPDFIPSSLVVPSDITLTPTHKEYLRLIFGIIC